MHKNYFSFLQLVFVFAFEFICNGTYVPVFYGVVTTLRRWINSLSLLKTKVSSTNILNYKSVFDGDVTNIGLSRIILVFLAVTYNYSQSTASSCLAYSIV